MEPREFETAYAAQHELRSDLGTTVERILGDLIAAEGVTTLSIGHRVKTRESALKKLAKSGGAIAAFDQMTDVLGLRVITYLRDEVDEVARVVEREFKIDEANSVDKRAILDPDRFGYLSLHYVASLSDERVALPEYRRFDGLKFELQIRSVLQHAWAEIEHDLGYKSESAVPRAERRAFSRLAGLLEVADDEFVRIRDRLVAHQASTEADVASGQRDVEIDQDSILALIRSGDPTLDEMDLEITRVAVGQDAVNAAPDRDYAGARATQLRRRGFHTLDELSAALVQHRNNVLEFARRWLLNEYPAADDLPLPPDADADHEPGVLYRATPERLASLTWQRGVALYYLATYLKAQDVLARFLEKSSWEDGVSLEDRAHAACLAATLGRGPIPLR